MPRFLIISDIHACDDDPSSSQAPSYVSSFNHGATTRIDPLADLQHLIRDEDLSPDYILCAGDITNRSNPNSFTYVWSKLHALADLANCRLVSTVGNHDLDSRYQANKFDPKGFAMSLEPQLPVHDRTQFLEFWAQNFTLITYPDCNILVLNTAAYHGAGADVNNEIEHGRISDLTLATLKRTVESADRRATNILLCHHHPIKGEQSDADLLGLTRGGDKLIDLLNRATSSWVVVHGHKHVPDLFYGHGGGSNAPVVLGSASFSAQVNRDAQNKNPNQVHLLTTAPDQAKSHGLTYAGIVKSWTWLPGIGWRKAYGTHGLPHVTGFGYKNSVDHLAAEIDNHLRTLSQNLITWKDALNVVPSLNWLVPVDFQTFTRALDDRGLRILTEPDGDRAQIGRRS